MQHLDHGLYVHTHMYEEYYETMVLKIKQHTLLGFISIAGNVGHVDVLLFLSI